MNNKKLPWFLLVAYIIILAVSVVQQGCKRAIDINEKEEVMPIIGHGSGGPAVLIASVTTSQGTTARDIKVYLLKSNDYTAKLAELIIDSLPRTFKIVELPLGSVDLFCERAGFFTIKKTEINLSTGETVLNEPLVLTRAVADTDFIIPGEVVVEFKTGVPREQMLQTIADANCIVKRADTPVIGSGRYFVLYIPDDKTVWEMVAFFNALPIIEYAVPSRVVRVAG